MDFRVLGPLEVTDGDREVTFSGVKQRAVLAILLLHRNELVPADRLIEELWGEAPPPTAAKSLQVHVSRLRHALQDGSANDGESVVVTRGGGYLIRPEPGELDLERFERLTEDGRTALAESRPEEALELLRAALALWRGPPLADFTYDSFAQSEIARLEELRLTAHEDRIEAELALGHHPQVIADLEALVDRHPFRERLRGQLMLALYRSGRQAEALDAYRSARQVLVDQLGIEPGDALRELEQAILTQDPSLAARSAPRPPPRADGPSSQPSGPGEAPRRRTPLAIGLLAAGLVVAGLIVLLMTGGDEGTDEPPLTDDSHAVAIIDPGANEVTEALSVGARPGPLAFDPESGSLWVGNVDDKTITHIDAKRRRVGRTLAIGDPPTGLAAGDGGVWVASANRLDPFVRVRRFSARFDTRERGLRVASQPSGGADLALTGKALWVAPSYGLLTRVDSATGSMERPGIDTRRYPDHVAADADAVWVADRSDDTVTRVDAASGLTTAIPVGSGPTGMSIGADSVWVALQLDTVARIDPATGSVIKTIPVGRAPAGIAVGAGAVWVANSGDGTVTKIDPDTDEVVATVPVGGSPQDVAIAGGLVWVSVRPRTLREVKPGGTALLVSRFDLSSLDPALGFDGLSWQLGYATGAKLLNNPDAPSPAASRLEPEVAESLPIRSADGRTYTFTIREGFKFSPPSGEPVTAQTFKYTIERSLHPRMHGPAGDFVSDIVGGEAYAAGTAKHLKGVTARGNKLRIRLTRPSGDLPARLSLPFFAAVPTDTPVDPEAVRTVASAGPYYVSSYAPREGAVLRRNPNYGGDRPRRLREIRVEVEVSPKQAVARVEEGTADYALGAVGTVVPDKGLGARYGPGSRAAQEGRQRYFVNQTLSLAHLAMNASRRLFSTARMRRAVNYAIDRRALAALGGPNNPAPAKPTDQYLPPGMPGFSDARIYPMTPDLERARRLAGGGRRSAVLYAFNEGVAPDLAEIIRANLKEIGIDVQVKLFSRAVMFEKVFRPGEPYDLVIATWLADFADPADFLDLFKSPESDWSPSVTVPSESKLADPAYDRRLLAAQGLSGPRRYLAYGRLDHDLARDSAPWAALSNEVYHDFFSARMGCQTFNPVYGMDLATLCIRD